jgi:hypothetical protein
MPRPCRSQKRSSGLGSGECGFRPFADGFGLGLGNSGQDVQGQSVGSWVIHGNELGPGIHHRSQKRDVAAQSV